MQRFAAIPGLTVLTLLPLLVSTPADAQARTGKGAQQGDQDWPMYRADPARSGYTRNKLPTELHLSWHYKPSQGPSPAWPRRERLTYDRAFQPIVAGRRLFYGSSTDGTVRALDTRTGRTLW